MYNFETVCKRFDQGADKWDIMLDYGVGREDGIIPFSIADMEFDQAPEIRKALIDKVNSTVMGYAGVTDAYFEAVRDWMTEHQHWTPKREWMVNTQSVVEGFSLAIKALTQVGDGVLLLTPIYTPMTLAIEHNHRRVIDCPLTYAQGVYTIDFAAFAKACQRPDAKMLILCNPHNPTGRVWSEEELTKIAEISLANGLLVVSDEIHGDLIMPGQHFTSYGCVSEEARQRAVICTAPSKTFNLAGLHTSNIFLPNPELRAKYQAEMLTTHPHPGCNLLGYAACEAAYRYCGPWLEEAIGVISKNRKILADFLDREMPRAILSPGEGTYLAWINLNAYPAGTAQEREEMHRRKGKLFFSEGYTYGKAGDGFIRWNLACPSAYMKPALERLKACYQD